MRCAFYLFFILCFSQAYSNNTFDPECLFIDYHCEIPTPLTIEDNFVKDIHENDYLFGFILHHLKTFEQSQACYYQSGAESAKMVAAMIANLGVKKDTSSSFLEFASGYGMVSRHLAKEIAPMRLVACDIHPQAVDFLQNRLGVNAIGSHYSPEKVVFNESFDVVFALSFFSHIPNKSFGRWLKVLYDAVKPGGYFIFTTHGRTTAKIVNLTIPSNGILFSPSSEQGDLDKREYGGSIVTPEYVLTQVNNYLNNNLYFFTEGFWWGHQDLYIVQKPSL